MSSTAQAWQAKESILCLYENSFVEIGGYVTARNTDSTYLKKNAGRWCHHRIRRSLTAVWSMFTVRMHLC